MSKQTRSGEGFAFAGKVEHGFRFESEGWTAVLHALDGRLWKVLLHRRGGTPPPSLSVAYGAEDCAEDGSRDKPVGYRFPAVRVETAEHGVTLETADMRVDVSLPHFQLTWYMRGGEGWLPLLRDRETGAYNLDGSLGAGLYHYTARGESDLHFGLGEKSGDVVKTHGRYRLCNIDCMGYDARYSDPLYKHFPYYMAKVESGFYAVYYDTPEDCVIDLGRELDNYHGLYQYFHSGAGYLDYYVLGGHDMDQIVTAFARLGGMPSLTPRWSLGYLASSMAYTDAPDAQERLGAFLETCRDEGIPVSGFHLSSGYTLIGDKRCVFTWDRGRFPDPAGLFARYAQSGVRVIANIKPCLLTCHPRYDECAGRGLFVRDVSGAPQLSQFWNGPGSYLDFTNPDTAAWWEEQVTDHLLAYGIASTWNDNNEFEIWDERARCAGIGGQTQAGRLKPVMTLEMIRASHRAQRRHAPDKRPFLISRAGCHGMQRYVQTWSGDNRTDWSTLRYNHKMGLNMSLSGIFNFGHDVGGFAGGKPGPELFLRWVQHGIFMPRFSIHSWNDDGSVNEPWMHPEITPYVRRLIVLRYRLMPYYYNLLYHGCTEYQPFIRPVFYNFPSFEDYESDLYMLGEDMLVANVFDCGVRALRVTLPGDTGWYCLWSGKYHPGGSEVECDVGFEKPVPVFMREGSVLFYDAGVQGFDSKDGGELCCTVFAPGSGAVSAALFMDDGESFAYRQGDYAMPRVTVRPEADALAIEVQNAGNRPLRQSLGLAVVDRHAREVSLTQGNLHCHLTDGGGQIWG